MTTAMSDICSDDYLLLGLATCFVKEDGEVHEIKVIEPIPSAALEALLKGIPTSYQLACGTNVGAVITGEKLQKPANFPESAQFCEDFTQRAIAAARTYKSRPNTKSHIPLGSTYSDFQYSVERKRVLNSKRVVTKEDNVKQHAHTHKVL